MIPHNKPILGSMFVSKNQEYVDAVRDYREFDLRNDSEKRFNFKMTDLQAAIGRVQLKKLNSDLIYNMSLHNQKLVDGNGSNRIKKQIIELINDV